MEAPVVEGRLGHGEPDPDDGSCWFKGEVERILVPGLPPGACGLEDELRQEDVDVLGGGDQLGHQVDDVGRVGEAGERRVAVQVEDLGHGVLGMRWRYLLAGLVALGHHLGAELRGQAGSRTTSVTRRSMALQVSAAAKPLIRTKPCSVHDDRCAGVSTGTGAGAGTCAGTGIRPSAPPVDRAARRPGGARPSA